MNSNHNTHTSLPYPRTRLLMVDGGRLGLRKHTVHGLSEFDVTAPRQAIHRGAAQTGLLIDLTKKTTLRIKRDCTMHGAL